MTGLAGTGPGPTAPTVAAAYDACEEITRTQARNFSYGIRLLPPPKRRALSAVYAFARRIDDIGDGDAPARDKARMLTAARADIARVGTDATDPVLLALADAARRLPIPVEAFGELIDGVEADLHGTEYESIEELVDYCRCVAGSIGRLSLGAFGGSADPTASSRANSLGVALQLTNILRDIREDLRSGRTYLPAEDLRRYDAGLRLTDDGEIAGPRWPMVQVVRFEAARARAWYSEGLRLLPMLDHRSAACCAAMSSIYRRLLDRIAVRPDLALQQRMSLPGWEKAGVAISSLAGAALPHRQAAVAVR
ncbi:MAG: phytoene/squalene synthase family protein [Mycobacteriales bacterium]